MYTQWLLDKIEEEWSQNEFMIWQDKVRTYSWLRQCILYWEGYLNDHSILPGEIVSFEGDYSPNIVALFFALLKNRNIIVPLCGLPVEEVHRRNKIANVTMRFIFEKDQLQSHQRIPDHGTTNTLLKKCVGLNVPGLVLFTSGSTGEPKGILHNLNTLTQRFVHGQKKFYKGILFLLFDHIGGINTMLAILSSGGTLVVPLSRHPEDVLKDIEKFKVTLLPTSPTFLNLLLISDAYKQYDCSSLKLITYGTEPMPEVLLKRLRAVFHNASFKQTYGTAEIGILSTQSESSETIWMKVGGEGYQVKVVDGILWIKSQTSMLGYLNAPSPFTEDGWFISGDKVETKDGYLKIIGREAQVINVAGNKVFPAEIENILLQMDNIKDVFVYGERNPITGQIVVVEVNLVENESLENLRKRIYKFCQEKLERYKIPARIEITTTKLHSYRFKKMRNK